MERDPLQSEATAPCSQEHPTIHLNRTAIDDRETPFPVGLPTEKLISYFFQLVIGISVSVLNQ